MYDILNNVVPQRFSYKLSNYKPVQELHILSLKVNYRVHKSPSELRDEKSKENSLRLTNVSLSNRV